MLVRGRSFTEPKLIVGGGGAFSTSESSFSPSPPRLYCYHEGRLEFFGHWDRREFRDSTFDLLITQPEIRLRIFPLLLFFLSTFLSLLNITIELGG
jgi:hypothetical protein